MSEIASNIGPIKVHLMKSANQNWFANTTIVPRGSLICEQSKNMFFKIIEGLLKL